MSSVNQSNKKVVQSPPIPTPRDAAASLSSLPTKVIGLLLLLMSLSRGITTHLSVAVAVRHQEEREVGVSQEAQTRTVQVLQKER